MQFKIFVSLAVCLDDRLSLCDNSMLPSRPIANLPLVQFYWNIGAVNYDV